MSANMKIVKVTEGEILYSYKTPVAVLVKHTGYFKTEEHFSKTTTMHVNKFCPKNVTVLNANDFKRLVAEMEQN